MVRLMLDSSTGAAALIPIGQSAGALRLTAMHFSRLALAALMNALRPSSVSCGVGENSWASVACSVTTVIVEASE